MSTPTAPAVEFEHASGRLVFGPDGEGELVRSEPVTGDLEAVVVEPPVAVACGDEHRLSLGTETRPDHAGVDGEHAPGDGVDIGR